MRTLLLLYFAATLTASGETITLSATATHDPVELWVEEIHSTETGTRRGASWDPADALRIPFTLRFPALELPSGATVTNVSEGWAGSWPEFHRAIPQNHTISVQPIQVDCDGTPCPYRPTIEHGMGLYAHAHFSDIVPPVEALASGYQLTGVWELGFAELTPSLTEPGFNSVTLNRWSATFAPFITLTASVDYTVEVVPEPSTMILSAAGLLAVTAFRALQPLIK